MKNNRMTRGAALLTGSGLILGALVGCADAGGGGGGDETSYTIAVDHQLLSVSFGTGMDNGVREKAAEIAKAEGVTIEVVSYDGAGDMQKQSSQIQNIITQGVDGIIIAPVTPSASGPLIDQAVRAGIPIGTMHGYVGDDPDVVYEGLSFQVNVQNTEMAKASAEALSAEIPAESDVAFVMGAAGFQDNDQAEAGIVPVFEEAGHTIVASIPGDWTLTGGQTACANILSAHPDVAAIYALNDDMAAGCAAAARAAGSSVLIGGNGASKVGIEAITKGEIFSTQCLMPFDEGQLAMESLWTAIKGETASTVEAIKMPVLIVTDKNLSECQPQY